MYVEKIEIPAFRVLRDVVLEFGEIYDPKIFPLGSENGGGKSTLLQLVFVLLHCGVGGDRIEYLRSLLGSDFYAGDEDERLIARLTVRLDGDVHVLEFVSLHPRFLGKKLDDPPKHGFISLAKRSVVEVLRKKKQGIAPQTLGAEKQRIQGLWTALNYHFITTHECSTPTGSETYALICRSPGRSASAVESTLEAAGSKIFLLGPSNQQYLFLGKNARRALLGSGPALAETSSEAENKTLRPQIEYLTRLDEAEGTLAGFYAYDWLSVEPLVRLFASARDEDFKSVVKTGSYGSSYNRLLREVNTLVVGKEVRPLDDLSGVEFIIKGEGGQEIPLSPEDLSQGELKRLMIYAWLRANHAHDALVLIDEIESSFHPDWQAGIVRDLQEWAPNTQFILATHSYEVCQALTPRHVRELRPKLRWGSTDATEPKEPEPEDG